MMSQQIERYGAGPAVLSYAVQGLTRDQQTARPGPGNWSIAELVAHLVDSDLVGADRMKRVIAEPEPTLVAYDQDAWIERLGSEAMAVDEAVDLFAANRRWMVAILGRCHSADFARLGRHTEAGPLTLAQLLTTYVEHLDHHLRFLYDKRANLGVGLAPRFVAR